jgi:hypothetical protein
MNERTNAQLLPVKGGKVVLDKSHFDDDTNFPYTANSRTSTKQMNDSSNESDQKKN